jgi:hypothetical protein
MCHPLGPRRRRPSPGFAAAAGADEGTPRAHRVNGRKKASRGPRRYGGGRYRQDPRAGFHRLDPAGTAIPSSDQRARHS